MDRSSVAAWRRDGVMATRVARDLCDAQAGSIMGGYGVIVPTDLVARLSARGPGSYRAPGRQCVRKRTSVRPPKHMPSSHKILLPTRAFLLSWRNQNLPARHRPRRRRGALRKRRRTVITATWRCSASSARRCSAWRTLQCCPACGTRPGRDLAITSERPSGLPSRPTTFGRKRRTGQTNASTVSLACHSEIPTRAASPPWTPCWLARAFLSRQDRRRRWTLRRDATRIRLRRVLGILAGDWKQFSPYFLAYKHGGLP